MFRAAARVFVLSLLLVVLSLAGRSGRAEVSAAVKRFESFPFAKQTLDPARLINLSLTELKYVRGIVFGRHGRVFDERVIQEYLQTRPWYRPNPKYRVEVLNAVERGNMNRIKEAEWSKHTQIEPGDLKFYRSRRITVKELGRHTGAEWRILRAEIEAIRGKRFPDEPWLQSFFNERYWYKPARRYDPRSLNAFELANLETITAAWKRQERRVVLPGDMGLFRDRPITPALLRGLSLYDLRLLRNEVYARRGQTFTTEWLRRHFHEQPWYRPSPTGRPIPLGGVERRNVALIVARERMLHEQVSTRPVDTKLLRGLYLEDARKLRNEIYARRGKVFRDPWLQGYFASLPWYKRNPRFREGALSPVEKRNAAAIRAYEKTAESALRQVAA